jgi:hypothetical protein
MALALAALSVALGAGAQSSPSKSSSIKSGFSSQRSEPAPARAPSQYKAPRGGFGSFGGAPSQAAQRSDSAFSQKLNKNASEANALRTLEQRRAAQAAREARPVPGYENRPQNGANDRDYGNANSQPYNRPYNQPSNAQMPMPSQPPVIVNNNNGGGMGAVVTGMVLGQMASGARAGNNGYPGQVGGAVPPTSTATVDQPPQGRSFFGSVLRTFMWLMVLSVVAWLAWFAYKRVRRGRAASKPNYSFERN